MRGLGLISLLLVLSTVTSANANVLSATSDYFKVEIKSELVNRNQIAYARFLKVNQWWHADHTYFGSEKNLRIESSAGGCFCERVSNRSVEHMRVIHADPGFLLRMRGALGPLQSLPVEGVLSWYFEPQGESTNLTLVYEVWGAEQANLDAIAPAVDKVLSMQVRRLQQFIATGDPEIRD